MIYGIGRNYASHAKELGNEVPKTEPLVFFKPSAAIVSSGGAVKLPSFSSLFHYEIEVAFRFGSNLEIDAVTVANDLTARDRQRQAQEKKAPWGLAKGFKQSCGLGQWVPLNEMAQRGLTLDRLEINGFLNGKRVQHGFTRDMIFTFEELRQYLMEHFPIQPEDIVLTGTPEGVGQVKAGDRIQAEVVGLSQGEWFFV